MRLALPRRRLAPALGPPVAYLALSLILFGSPVLAHPARTIIAADQIDSSLFQWFYAWWPHAVLHGLDPLVTRAILAPDGFNLTWTTSMPLPSLLLAPVTLGLGPAVTWNVIQLLAPALSAWSAYLLCRQLTRRAAASLVGGVLYGFSPYMLIHLTGGPFLALVPVPPLLILLVLRRLDGSLSARRFVTLCTLALIVQFLISTEVLASATLFGAIALSAAWALDRERRAELAAAARLLGLSYGLTAVLMSPYLLTFFLGTHFPPTATDFAADLVSPLLPPPQMLVSHGTTPLAGSGMESYLGVPLLLIIALFALRARGTRGRLLLIMLAATAVAALGAHLVVAGHRTGLPLPWLVLEQLPVLRYAIPVRFWLFTGLAASLIAALWLAERPTAGRWLLAALAVAFVLPQVGNAAWRTDISDPAFFATGAYRSILRPADRVLTIPQIGPSMRWQADTRFAFTLVGGGAALSYPVGYTRYAAWRTLMTGRLTAGSGRSLRAFVTAKRVTAIVVADGFPGPWRRYFAGLGVRPVHTGGVLLYRLSASDGRFPH